MLVSVFSVDSFSHRPREVEPFAVAVDIAVFTIRNGAVQVALVRRGEEPFLGHWALLGGFVRSGEDLDQAAARELAEETGLQQKDDWYLEQLRSYGAPDRDPRMRVVTVAYVAVAATLPRLQRGGDAALASLRTLQQIRRDGLAFDHASIVRDALERVRSLLEYTTLAARFLPPVFTPTELRKVYEAVWGVSIDPRNFRRNIEKSQCFVDRSSPSDASIGRRPRGRPPSRWSVKEAAPRDQPGALLLRALASRDRGGSLLGIRTRPTTERPRNEPDSP